MRIRLLVGLLAGCMLTPFIAGSAVAGDGWYPCIVTSVGPVGTNSDVMIQFTEVNRKFVGMWTTAHSNQANRMLATALTAVAAGKGVWAMMDTNDVPCILKGINLNP